MIDFNPTSPNTKECIKCKVLLSRHQFNEYNWKKYYFVCKACIKIEKANWYFKNASTVIEKQQDRYIRNKDEILNKRAQQYRKQIETEYGRKKIWLSATKTRAKKKGLEFNLSLDDLIIPTHCPVLGIKLENKLGMKQDSSPSIDRFDSSKGYTKDNINIISCRANLIKVHGTAEEHYLVYKWMKNNERV